MKFRIKYLLPIFILSVLSFTGHAQKKTIDSLVEKLNTSLHDTDRVKTLLWLADKTQEDSSTYALRQANDALELAVQCGYKKGQAVALYREAIITNMYTQDLTISFKHCIEALKVCEEIRDTSRMAQIYELMGYIYLIQTHYDKSEEVYKKAEKYHLRVGNKEKMSELYGAMSKLYLSKGQMKKAMECCEKGMAIFEETHDEIGKAKNLLAMANILKKQDKKEESLIKYTEAMLMFKKMSFTSDYIYSMIAVASLYSDLNKTPRAIQMLDSALMLSVDMKSKSNELYCYQVLVNVNMKIRDFEKALNYMIMYYDIRDSIYSQKKAADVANLESGYLQEKKDAVAEVEKQKQKVVMYLLGGGFIVVLLLSLFIYRGYTQKRKANIIISQQKQTVEEKQKEIIDSIRYAKRIQMSLLASEKYIYKSIDRLKIKK